MPFYAKDWRSPGESWIKTEDGWEKLKILECRQGTNRSIDDDKENCNLDNSNLHLEKIKGGIPPYCQITLKCTKEVAGFNGLSDAIRRLDFCSAVHDHRRFLYTAKLLELLLSQQRITTLSGCAQKSVLNVLEEIAVQTQQSQQNVHVLAKLLSDLRRIVRDDSWWGKPIGSSQLWGKHVRTIDRIDAIASSIQSTEAATDDKKPKFEDLPEECIREILLRLADHRDLLSAAEAYSVAQKLSAEQRLWKRLCHFHFSPMQINFIMKEMQKEREKPPLPEADLPLPLNNLNKINRNVRTSHPYLNNNPRRSPVRGTAHDSSDSPSTSEVEVVDQTTDESMGNVRVSLAFHEHLKRHRESLLSQQKSNGETGHCNNNANHARLVSFQDVRNHFDQQLSRSTDNSSRQTISNNKKKNDNDNKKTTIETDWEDVFHRCRRLFGLREDYAETLHLCRNCRCLFWKTHGHPCIGNNGQPMDDQLAESSDTESFYVPVPPQAFLKFFSL